MGFEQCICIIRVSGNLCTLTLFSDLPQAAGWLPLWQLLISVTAVFNSVQNFVTLKLTRKIYPQAAVTGLQARTFAVWTLTSAVVRAYAAYNINEKHVYDLTLFTYLIAFGHFSSELLIFRTATVNPGLISPVIVSTTSLVWMISQYDFYVKSP
ncbi:Erg28 like protein-domain-containing protein [Armillaria novae-zelandiae]|uniref:Erg28 like protein-domain-containing protein n=1 Tax=Armillaria novae-zelandiae TaxID=153914 RepID=A0AA39UMR6_9AGAR|nr:Erg28 like protein-domain-containing protein [Armillaria novae-zelandiae]